MALHVVESQLKSRRVLTRRTIIMLKRRDAGSSGWTIGLLWAASAWAGIELVRYSTHMISSATKYGVRAPGEATGTQNPTGVLGCKKGSKRGVFNTV